MPAVLGYGQRFRPHCTKIRLFYGSVLISLAIGTQMAFVYLYQFLQIGLFEHQVATVDELIDGQFELMGSAQVFQLIGADQKVFFSSFSFYFSICSIFQKKMYFFNLFKNDIFKKK